MNIFLDGLIDITLRAGKAIMDVYQGGFEAREKSDGSSVTDADEAGEAIIVAGLKAVHPDIPILAEEAASRGEMPELGSKFFLVDPLDGTKEFVNRTAEFTVNIALVENGRPVAGVVLAPALGKMWFGAIDTGAFVQEIDPATMVRTGVPQTITVRIKPENGLIAVASRSHRSAETESLLTKLGAEEFKPAGSSLKFCLVAEGQADVYPRLGRTMEWDTGAGQAVLEAAGGRVHELDGETEGGPLLYGKKERGYDNPHFIAWGA
ncbi:3'(2'),5'-bisphosphate nucleotidase CysQ [Parvularcula sp. LCG005]|uniref:3'(2'),5'-bisphosphate nucleotidase CysQ n=1 Tax=Parvularcula sp. LCG005 TaxID=3078805 RepID=UPI00294211B1|nr:3'(2'),5'-bisphosphate nucleotidase CysQ [Parvularcula sp. LCG005]WOI53665.1 3'(2'),5'-bisphosphate nucleotidase CysQ [Parvularcula sp. LCG005]